MTTLTYKVRANRDGDGGYTLSFGKGGKKISLRAVNPGGKGWRVINSPPDLMGAHPKIGDLKALFETYCQRVYGDVQETAETDPSGIIPPPPSRKKKGPPTYQTKRSDVSDHNQWQADPLNPDFFVKDGKGRRRYTEIGVLTEIWGWARSHYPDPWSEMPFTNVAMILRRKYPDNELYKPPTPVEKKQ